MGDNQCWLKAEQGIVELNRSVLNRILESVCDES